MLIKNKMEKIESCLYIVATPIGNLEELSPRAQYILSNVDLIACEDTRVTIKLLSHFNISKPLVSCHKFNESTASLKLVEEIKEGKSIAMVSDAGYPGVSDPGGILIKTAIENDINIHVISGPSAGINALIGSGLPSDHFYFHGFLQMKNRDRKIELTSLALREETIILYEAPHHFLDTMEDLMTYFGKDRKCCIARELTKLHEEFYRGTLLDAYNYYQNGIKGEIVIVIDKKEKEIATEEISPELLIKEIDLVIENGSSCKDAIKIIADKYNLQKNEVYRIYHN